MAQVRISDKTYAALKEAVQLLRIKNGDTLSSVAEQAIQNLLKERKRELARLRALRDTALADDDEGESGDDDGRETL